MCCLDKLHQLPKLHDITQKTQKNTNKNLNKIEMDDVSFRREKSCGDGLNNGVKPTMTLQ